MISKIIMMQGVRSLHFDVDFNVVQRCFPQNAAVAFGSRALEGTKPYKTAVTS